MNNTGKRYQAYLIGLLITILSVSCRNCTEFEHNDPQPFADSEEYVMTATKQWLDVRMDEYLWDDFSDPNAQWRTADSLPAVASALSFLGNFQRKIDDIKASDRFKIDDDVRLLYIIKQALSEYNYDDYEEE